MKQRGLTIAELLIGMGILSVIMTLCYGVMHSAGRQVRQAASDTETQKAALLTLQRLAGQATYSDYRSLSVTETAFSFLSSESPDTGTSVPIDPTYLRPSGTISATSWQKFLFFYYEADKMRIMAKEFAYSDGQKVAQIDKGKFDDLKGVSNSVARRICENITHFVVHRPGPNTIYIEVSSMSQKGAAEQATNLTMKFSCRNGM